MKTIDEIFEKISAVWSPQAREAAALARKTRKPGEQEHEYESRIGGGAVQIGIAAMSGNATHQDAHDAHSFAAKHFLNKSEEHNNLADGDYSVMNHKEGDKNRAMGKYFKNLSEGHARSAAHHGKLANKIKSSEAILDRLDPVKQFIRAGAPMGNKNAAGHGDSIARHDTARFAAKTPQMMQAHTASMAAHKASENASDEAGHRAAAKAHAEAAAAHQSTDWGAMPKEERSERVKNIREHQSHMISHMAEVDKANKSGSSTTISEMNRKNREQSYRSGSDD